MHFGYFKQRKWYKDENSLDPSTQLEKEALGIEDSCFSTASCLALPFH